MMQKVVIADEPHGSIVMSRHSSCVYEDDGDYEGDCIKGEEEEGEREADALKGPL